MQRQSISHPQLKVLRRRKNTHTCTYTHNVCTHVHVRTCMYIRPSKQHYCIARFLSYVHVCISVAYALHKMCILCYYGLGLRLVHNMTLGTV